MSDPITQLGVIFEMTADPHSRKVMFHDAFIGTLLFHDWEFKLELGPNLPIRLDVAAAILEKAQGDDSIKAQKADDMVNSMIKNARKFLADKGIEEPMTDKEAVRRYIDWK